ncbi:MAG: DUF924 family protein [Chroococcidiopsidaceae cyanobacterium CP_BM_ER_R8_30]|nr:DUF924 family protein [Chroococcidiopsidaceae cyanobacterium CP_BM_ER_R8_30]
MSPQHVSRYSSAFATAPQAITAAEHAITMGFDLELMAVQRWFVYLPFEHSENLAHQYRSVELFSNSIVVPSEAERLALASLATRLLESAALV